MQHEPSAGAVAQAQPGVPGVPAGGDGVRPGDERDDRDGGVDVGALEPGQDLEPVGAGVVAVDVGEPRDAASLAEMMAPSRLNSIRPGACVNPGEGAISAAWVRNAAATIGETACKTATSSPSNGARPGSRKRPATPHDFPALCGSRQSLVGLIRNAVSARAASSPGDTGGAARPGVH